MPKPKEPSDDRERREREQRARQEDARREHGRHEHEPHEDEHDGPGDQARPRRRRMGREHAVHQQIVERRLGGGAPATPEAYVEALKEWHQLPGAVIRPPTDEKQATEPEKQATEESDREKGS